MRKLKLPCFAVLLLACALHAADFKQAVVILPASPTTPEKKAAQMLVEEITKRTQLRLKIGASGSPAIYLRLGSGKPESFTSVPTSKLASTR